MEKGNIKSRSIPQDSEAQKMPRKYVREVNLKEKFFLGLMLEAEECPVDQEG